jgi:hypothetical protein
MNRILAATLVLLVARTPIAAAHQPPPQPASPAEQYQAIAKQFNAEGYALRQAKTDEEREQAVGRAEKLTLQLLELAEKNPKDPAAMDALVQAVTQEIWMENNTSHPGWGQNSPEVRAIAVLLRDHVRSDKAAEACRRMSYGFRKECETFLLSALRDNPQREVRGLAGLRLAQFLNGRLQRLELLKERPEMAQRYAGLFGQEYLAGLQQQGRAAAIKEAETVFEQVGEQYPDVKLPYGGTVGEKARSELYEIRNLAVGKPALEIEGDDQDGKPFKLSDYRGKVVLLYFWSEY